MLVPVALLINNDLPAPVTPSTAMRIFSLTGVMPAGPLDLGTRLVPAEEYARVALCSQLGYNETQDQASPQHFTRLATLVRQFRRITNACDIRTCALEFCEQAERTCASSLAYAKQGNTIGQCSRMIRTGTAFLMVLI
jgi:hypothetical protein